MLQSLSLSKRHHRWLYSRFVMNLSQFSELFSLFRFFFLKSLALVLLLQQMTKHEVTLSTTDSQKVCYICKHRRISAQVYRVKKNGEHRVPSGVTVLLTIQSDTPPFSFTVCGLFVRQSLIQVYRLWWHAPVSSVVSYIVKHVNWC